MYANRIKKSLTKLLGIVALLALSLPGYANIDSVKASQLNLDLETGSTAFGIKGEGLIPLYLKANKAIYTDLEGSYDTKSKGYSIELGGGYRQIEDINLGKYFHKNMILGGYAFLDMTRAKGAEKHRTLLEGNIGGELYNATESLSINAYIPLSKHKWTDETEWGSANQEIIEGHNLYNTKYRLTELTPNWGLDIEAGHTIPIPGAKNNLKGYLGGYYENQDKGQNSDGKTKGSIKGISAKATYQINKYIMVEAQDSYDNYRNNEIMVGAKVTLGKSETNGLEEELLQGVNHNIAGAGMIGAADTLTTNRQEITQGSQTVEGHTHLFDKTDHVYFFDASGSNNANGSYENPYSYADLTNGTLSQIAQENPDYSHIFVTGTTPTNIGELTLGANESLEGRYGSDNGYEKAATLANEAEMPMLKGSLMLEGGSESHPQEISGIKLYNEEGKYSDGIQAGGASNGATYIELNQMQLGESTVSGNTNNYETGINIKGGANLSATGSNLNAITNGILVENGNTAGAINIGEGTTLMGGIGAGIENSGIMKEIVNAGKISSTSGVGIKDTGTIDNNDEFGNAIDNSGTIGDIVGGTQAGALGTIQGNGSGILNDGTIGTIAYLREINSTDSKYNFAAIYNLGAIAGIINNGVISSGSDFGIKNIGVIGRRGVYGIENLTDGEIEDIVEISLSAENYSVISGIKNAGKIRNVQIDAGEIGSSEVNYGIENTGTIGKINLSSQMIAGGIELVHSEIKGGVYGIYNLSTGNIEGINGQNTSSLGTVEGKSAGIYNVGTMGNVEGLAKIEGTGADSYGIRNEGTMGNIVNPHTGVITGSMVGIDSGLGTTAIIGDIINTGIIGGANTVEGVSLMGQAGNVVGLSSSDPGYTGTIEGSDRSIFIYAKSNTVTNISHLDLIGAIALEGTVGNIENNTIEGTGNGMAIYSVLGDPVTIGDIKGNTFKDFTDAVKVEAGSTIQNAGTFTADNTFDNVTNTGISYKN